MKGETPTNKDNRLSLHLKEEYRVTICFIFIEMQEIVFENILIILGYRVVRTVF